MNEPKLERIGGITIHGFEGQKAFYDIAEIVNRMFNGTEEKKDIAPLGDEDLFNFMSDED